jgi:surface protein
MPPFSFPLTVVAHEVSRLRLQLWNPQYLECIQSNSNGWHGELMVGIIVAAMLHANHYTHFGGFLPSTFPLCFQKFAHSNAFNGNIGSWDVSKVTTMDNMFSSANGFNQDLSQWDTSSVVNANAMFSFTNFNSDLSAWNGE